MASAIVDPPPTRRDANGLEVLLETVREERRLLESQADRQYAQLSAMLGWASALLLTIMTLFGGAVVWFMGSTRKDATAFVLEFIEREGREKIQNYTAQFREQMDADSEGLRAQLSGMKAQLNELRAYRSKRVVWVHEGRSPVTAEGQLLEGAGVQVDMLTPADGSPLDVLPADLVIFTYDGAMADPLLGRLIDRVKDNLSPTPIIVYAKARFTDEGERQAGRYLWLMPANYPLTLLSSAMAILMGINASIGGSPRA